MTSDIAPRLPIDPMTPGNWKHYANSDTFNQFVGPFFYLLTDLPDEPARVGFRVESRHCNPMGNCHGGMLATMLDIGLGFIGLQSSGEKIGIPTISMSIDFLQVAANGEWIETRARLVHATRRILFMEGTLVTSSGPVARGNAIYRRSSPVRSDEGVG